MLNSKIRAILREDDALAFSVDVARKDLSVLNATWSLVGVATPVTAAGLAAYANAAAAGWAEQDLARLITFAVDRAGCH